MKFAKYSTLMEDDFKFKFRMVAHNSRYYVAWCKYFL